MDKPFLTGRKSDTGKAHSIRSIFKNKTLGYVQTTAYLPTVEAQKTEKYNQIKPLFLY